MKYLIFWILFIGINHASFSKESADRNLASDVSYQIQNYAYLDRFYFSQIPILHNGRVKPLSTFSREYLTAFYGRSSLKNLSAEEWLMETLFDPIQSLNRPIFKIVNPDVANSLNLKKNRDHIYSFNEVSKSLDSVLQTLAGIQKKEEKDRDVFEKQMLDLYFKVHSYFQLHHALFMILPLFSLESSFYAKQIGIQKGKKYNLLEMMKFQRKIKNQIRKLKPIHLNTLSQEEQQLILLSFRMDRLLKDSNNFLFKIIPPQWKEHSELWIAPWEVINQGKGSPASSQYMKSWEHLEQAYRTKDFKSASQSVYQKVLKISKNFISPTRLFMEKIFNDIQFFKRSLMLYIFAFLSLLLSRVFWKKFLYKSARFILQSGFVLHLIGILFRIIIMKRPPVSTLYESILFVGLIIVGFFLLLEKKQHLTKLNYPILIGSLAGSVLHFVALKYKGAEAMSLLVPVLNTNFWLATHVTCITIGYACAIVSSLISHIYMFSKCLFKSARVNHLYASMNDSLFLALFFCLFGTILGGIWADQSWGRFWGWDPKENGALGLVIWLLVLIHGRLAGLLKDKEFAAGVMLTNVMVALSWFGVNLLSVGLHSYGFVEGVLWGLIGFCVIEIGLTFSSYTYLKYNKRKG